MNDFTSIAITIQTGLPTLIWGYPGEAKTSLLYAFAAQAKRELETVIASHNDPSAFNGLPLDRPDGVVFSPPAWARRLSKEGNAKPGVLFLDEISTVPPTVQAVLLRVLLEKIVGDLYLHPDTWMVAAANPPEVAANGFDLSPPTANRFVHFYDWQVNADLWTDGMVSGWKSPSFPVLPSDWRETQLPSAKALVASYIRRFPQRLRVFPKQADQQAGPWPSPRSWEMAAKVFAAHKSVDVSPSMALAGAIGQAAATEFLQFVKALDLPDPESILRNPTGYDLPKEDDRAYVALTQVTAVVLAKNTKERWQAAWKVLATAATKHKRVDLAGAAARSLAENPYKAGPELPVQDILPFMPILQKAGVMMAKK